jgi:ribonuclease T2
LHVPARFRVTALAAAAILCACDDSAAITHYVLALSWQPAFCEFNADRPECRALDSADFAATHLSVHGLWPNDSPGSGPSHCGVDQATRALDEPKSWCELPKPKLDAETRAALEPAMPGVASCLDRHEWIKHGTCAGTDADDYFADTVRLAGAIQAMPLAQVIADNIGRYVTTRQLTNAFEVTFGAGSGQALTLACTRRGGAVYLSEIRIALEPSALEGILDRDDLYLEGPAPAGTCPDTVRIDRAGP